MSLNDEFSDSDESDPDDPPISTRGNEQDFSLGRFAPNSASHMGRSAPDLSQFSSNSAANAAPKKQTVSKPTTKPKVYFDFSNEDIKPGYFFYGIGNILFVTIYTYSNFTLKLTANFQSINGS